MVYDDILTKHWTEFVGWDARKQTEIPFLTDVLREHSCRKVLNAALGDGFSTVYLLKSGFDLTSNEIDAGYEKVARENAKKQGLELKVTRYDWREMNKMNEKFDAVILLGNSLCLLEKKNEHLLSLKNFRSLLNDGGILVIDHRNFDRLLAGNQFGKAFTYTKDYVYTGDSIDCFPIEKKGDMISFYYVHRNKGKVGELQLYPFRFNEHVELLKNAGYSKIKSYSDYREGRNPNADFFQHVCVK